MNPEDLEKQIDETMASLDAVSRAKAPASLTKKVNQRLSFLPKRESVPLGLKWNLAAVIALLIINIGVLINFLDLSSTVVDASTEFAYLLTAELLYY